jgi:hypothetical protein
MASGRLAGHLCEAIWTVGREDDQAVESADVRGKDKISKVEPGMNMPQATHDTFTDHQEIEGPSNRNFGFTVGGILIGIALVRGFFFEAGPLSTALFAIPGSLLVLFAIGGPSFLGPLNSAWSKLGLLLARIVNPAIMAIIYFLVFVPIGLGMKLFGRDALNMKRPTDANSFWIDRSTEVPAVDTMKNQF